MMHEEGVGTEKNVGEARRLLEIAASQGHIFAKRQLGRLFLSGSLGLPYIPKGIWMLLISIPFELIAISVRGDWKDPAFEERMLA
jgi:TPR repeat protein